MIIIAPKVYHSYKPDTDTNACTQKYNLKFKPDDSFYASGLFERFEFKYVQDASAIISIIENIQRVYDSDEFASKQEIQSLFSLLMIHLLRCMTTDSAYEMAERRIYDSQAGEIETFFEKHYDSFPPPSELAQQLRISTRQLDRILKQLFSMSFSCKLAQTKTELAKDLLETTELTAATISDKLGYNSPASFSAAFKKQTGLSPGTYRKNNI
jgi:AraC-like DNA-binding protein